MGVMDQEAEIIQPNKLGVKFYPTVGPLAEPIFTAVEVAGGVRVVSQSGLTKVEWAATQLLSAMIAKSGCRDDGTIKEMVKVATKLMIACERNRTDNGQTPTG